MTRKITGRNITGRKIAGPRLATPAPRLRTPRLSRSALLARRSFLTSAGATAASLPFLRALPGYAQADAQPKLVLAFSGNGRVRHLWGADDSTGELQFRQNLAPLQPYAQHVCIPDGIRNFGAPDIGGTHEGGCMSLFTGAGGSGLNPESTGPGVPSIDTLFMSAQSGSARSDSFYQQVVAELNSATSAGPNNRVVFDAGGNRRDPFRSAWEATEQYFAGLISDGSAQDTGPDPRQLARTKVLDTLNAQLGDLEGRLCGEDYYQMQAMRDAIAQANNAMNLMIDCELPQLPAKPAGLETWEPLWTPPAPDVDLSASDSWYRLNSRLASDLLVLALACGVTRSGVLQFSQGASEARAVGHPDSHHNISHGVPQLFAFSKAQPTVPPDYEYYAYDYQTDPSNPDLDQDLEAQYGTAWSQLSDWETFYAEEMAYLIGQLEQFGVLSDTLVIWGSEIDDGQHKHLNMPYLIAAGEQIPIQRGKVVRFPLAFDDDTIRQAPGVLNPLGEVRSSNDLLRTVLHAVGVETSSVGAAQYNVGLLDELLV